MHTYVHINILIYTGNAINIYKNDPENYHVIKTSLKKSKSGVRTLPAISTYKTKSESDLLLSLENLKISNDNGNDASNSYSDNNNDDDNNNNDNDNNNNNDNNNHDNNNKKDDTNDINIFDDDNNNNDNNDDKDNSQKKRDYYEYNDSK
jgi:hypothetical protein